LTRTIAALLALLLLLAGCGEREDPPPASGAAATEQLDLVLDYFPNADHAGIYGAQATGAFDDAKLEVRRARRATRPRRCACSRPAGRHRRLLRARGAARPRPRRQARRDRRAGPEAADLDHLGRP
jgi:hypothetical protein